MPSPLRRTSPLGKQLLTPRGAAMSIGSSPRNHQHQHQHQHHNNITRNNYPYSSPATKFSSPSNKRGSSSGGGGANIGSNNRAGTFYVLLLCFMPLVFVWQWWIFWINQNHILHQENQYEQQQQQPATTPLSLLMNQPRIHAHGSSIIKTTTSTGSSIAASAFFPTIKSETQANDASSSVRRHSGTFSSTDDSTKSSATSSIKDYDYSRFPILSKDFYQPHSSNPLHVIFVDQTSVLSQAAAAAATTPLLPSRHNQTRSLLLEGLERSRYIHVVTGLDQYASTSSASASASASAASSASRSSLLRVHLIDWASLDRDCHLLERYYNGYQHQSSTFFSKDHHVLVYYDTSASARVVNCPLVNAMFGSSRNIRIVKQAIVVNRHWDPQGQWTLPGRIADNNGSPPDKQTTLGYYPILHASVFLRESFVELLVEALEKEQGNGSDNGISGSGTTSLGGGNWSKVSTMLAQRKRKLDLVTHLRKGDYARYSFLRRLVGQEVMHLGNKTDSQNNSTSFTGYSHKQQEPRSLRTLVRIMGDERELETNGGVPQAEYVLSLLTTKIVIVAQHDEWEDHERLLQAMASGAMVMTDAMLAPPHGIKNGTNIVMYDSASSLVRLVWHYLHPKQTQERLKIAQQGCQLVYEKHRSWHRMEQVLFGSTRSKAGQLQQQLLQALPFSSSTTKQQT